MIRFKYYWWYQWNIGDVSILMGLVKVGSNVQKNDVLVDKLVSRFNANRKKEGLKELCGDELSSR